MGGQGYHFQQEELKAPEATCTEQRVCRAEIGLPESRTLDQGCHRGLQLPQGPHQAFSPAGTRSGRPSKRTPQSASELALAAHKLDKIKKPGCKKKKNPLKKKKKKKKKKS